MIRAADDAELRGGPELRAALVAYVERGTRLAHAPLAGWGWGAAPPYQS